MAPEVQKQKDYDTKADVYSWGMCVYSFDNLEPNPPTTPEAQIQVSY